MTCLFLIFSDKTTVKVNGYNACPDGFKAFFSNVRDIFNEHADYSRYAITELSEENCVRMIVEFYDGIGRKNDFKADIYSDEECRTYGKYAKSKIDAFETITSGWSRLIILE